MTETTLFRQSPMLHTPQTISAVFQETVISLTPISNDSAPFEAEQILQHVLSCSRTGLYTSFNSLISEEQRSQINNLVNRCLLNEPLSYVLGSAYFHSKEFMVTNDVLIPRPDTEVLVETVLKLEKAQHCFFADIGIGSGAIAASIALQKPSWTAIGVDISVPALKIAQKNCSQQVLLCAADVFSAFKPQAAFDFIVSNPPYIAESEKQNLDSSVIDFEPHVALFDNADGLTFYKVFAKQADKYLKPGGSIYCEIGYLQGVDVTSLFTNNGWADVTVLPDLAGRNRVLIAKSN